MTQNKNKQRQAGFTLVEILVVIVIIGLLATIVGTNVIGALLSSKESTARTQVLEFKKTVEVYYLQEGQLPESLEELIEAREGKPAYMTGVDKIPQDPWKNDYILRQGDSAGQFEVICLGPDGEEGTEDDISSNTAKNSKGNG